MTALPIAAFLAGALLSLLLPTLLLIALVVWYWGFVRRVPGPSEPADAPPAPSATNPSELGQDSPGHTPIT